MYFQVKIKSEPLSDEAYDDGVVIDGSYPVIEVCMSQHSCWYGMLLSTQSYAVQVYEDYWSGQMY